MSKRHYMDYFTVPEDYKANMTREAINETPETWLDFYPHDKYVDFLETLLQALKSGSKSIWLTGNYGTGKSNAALVTQKLFMDDENRVRKWFDNCNNALSDGHGLLKRLLTRRSEGTLVVYDYNAAGIGANEDFLVRLERGIIAALNGGGMQVPTKANFDAVILRLREEGQLFLDARDAMQGELAYLHSGIATIEQLIAELEKAYPATATHSDLLGDVQKVFHARSIYLDISVSTFKKWIRDIVDKNNIARVVYIFDEFHPFVEANKENLKTFEEVAENPELSNFYFVPVTHMQIQAYWAEGSSSAKKSNDRFHFRNLQMPNDTAFKLAAHAMKPIKKMADEWKQEKGNLWESVRGIAESHFKDGDVARQSFFDILPIHPMAAFMLKFLSESTRSNQRSIFEYLKGSADGREFQDFIRVGGPAIASKQFLTTDYLWKYFIERDDLGVSNDITSIRNEFERIKNRDFQNKNDDDEDLRVLKTVLLFCLLNRFNPDGHERLKPTVENIVLAFQGDGAVVNVKGTINELEKKHCFSVMGGNIELFASSVGGGELASKVAEFESKFHELLSGKTEDELGKSTLRSIISSFSAGRFDVRVSDVQHTTVSNLNVTTREKYSSMANKDTGAVCLWFVVAKNRKEQLQVPDKIKSLLLQLKDHRIVMFAFPSLTFCDTNQNLWNDYTTLYAQYMLENDATAKGQYKNAYERVEKDWISKLKKQDSKIQYYTFSNENVVVNDTSWSLLKTVISDYVRRTMPMCLDCITAQSNAFGFTGLSNWAMAGIKLDAAGQYKQLVNNFKAEGITGDDAWFAQYPDHPFAQLRALFDKKIVNTIGKGMPFSVRKTYIELKRAPYGMRCNGLSAFSLGLALRHILDKDYQWDNGQKTGTLDDSILAEIVESVVKDDGQNKMKNEKEICRLSTEAKIFIEKAPSMFGIVGDTVNARVEDVLLSIQNRVEEMSGRVPLWVLSHYIRCSGQAGAGDIAEALDAICFAGRTSSKSNNAIDRTDAIKKVGGLIRANPDFVNDAASFIKPDKFVTAFKSYLDEKAPHLVQLANQAGDRAYNQTVLAKAAESAGFLWNEEDIDAEINETIHEYDVICRVKDLSASVGVMPYGEAIEWLRKAIMQSNKLPKAFIANIEPSLEHVLTSIESGGAVRDIRDGIDKNFEVFKEWFFDDSRKKIVELLNRRLGNIGIQDSDLLDIYNSMPSMFTEAEAAFWERMRERIEIFSKDSRALNIKREWMRVTNSESPSEWGMNNGLPARFAIDAGHDSEDILAAVQTPEKYSIERLSELLTTMKELSPLEIADAQKHFIDVVIPKKYVKFNFGLASLLDFLRKKYGKAPNSWPMQPDIDEFLRAQYKGTFAPQVADRIKKTSPEDLKKKVLRLTQESPDLGLLFWE